MREELKSKGENWIKERQIQTSSKRKKPKFPPF
jgi:hypothetical protein